jgi:cytochrome c
MDDRFNTAAGWVLFSGIIALGLSVLSYKYFHADDPERPEQLGYVIEGVESETAAAVEMTMAQAVNMMSAEEQIAAGERVFAKCAACHTIEQGGANGIGPNLYAVMGAAIGSHVPGYAYSDALAGHGGQWNWDTMNEWLKNPRGFADGTKMSFAGLPSIEDRAAVAMYMNSFGSNLPVPEYVEVLAEEAGEELAAEEATEGEEAAPAE